MADPPRRSPPEGPGAFFLVGTTASGKSAAAQFIAERGGHRVVSADSMNLYRGMDVGTAKPSPAERARVEYAGIDLADPTEAFSVAAYLEAVRPAFGSGRETIVAGGTGLYVKCLTEGFDDVPPGDARLRAELEALGLPELQRRAKAEAAALYEKLPACDRENPRRLVRILEMARGPSRPVRSAWGSRPRPKVAGLRIPRPHLLRRIVARTERMYADGLLDEARALMGRTLSRTARQAIGYAEAFAVLRQEISLDEAKERTIIRTRRLAKRQATWFRNQLDVEWIDVPEGAPVGQVAGEVLALWRRIGKTPVVLQGG